MTLSLVLHDLRLMFTAHISRFCASDTLETRQTICRRLSTWFQNSSVPPFLLQRKAYTIYRVILMIAVSQVKHKPSPTDAGIHCIPCRFEIFRKIDFVKKRRAEYSRKRTSTLEREEKVYVAILLDRSLTLASISAIG